ncbi:4a-hydroxytetrahydrobiopterin dehydratase [Candidatus Pacebacteria bacterium]|nr:4a-hydroxytetrahydrobiopterin dehydratase [Candidatus Paceibacterota bacterium]
MKQSALLKAKEISRVLKKYPDWSVTSNKTQFYRTFTFPKHIDALVFIARITVHAEVLQHHPEVIYSYSKVKVKLTTHDVKGLTKLDVLLLERIEKLCSA